MKSLRRALLLCLAVPFTAHAILPLPYPTEPLEEELTPGVAAQKESKTFEGYNELFSKGQLREMELPTFEGQREALGYVPGSSFTVPPELKPRVDFWKSIYAEYTSRQAVLHDSSYPEITYGVLDLGAYVAEDGSMTREQRRKLARFLKDEKEKIVDQLRILDEKKNDPIHIPNELFPLFRKFEAMKDPEKFAKAQDRVRAQVGQRDRIVKGFLYAGRYLNRMMDIFEKKRLPKELTRLPLVESAFNLGARSKVGASGVWQFMRTTGKRYLRIDRAVDERNDPIAATWAAAELLRGNYDALTAWPLAVTAYNHGREGMARAVRELATRDLPTIIRSYKARSFGFASSNFYSEFLAILEVERDYRKYFGNMKVDKPLEFEEFRLADNVKFDDIASACGLRHEDLAVMNPALTDWVISGGGYVPQGYLLRVPPGSATKCRSGYRNVTKVSRHDVRPWHRGG